MRNVLPVRSRFIFLKIQLSAAGLGLCAILLMGLAVDGFFPA
jgi:hypothetical protein